MPDRKTASFSVAGQVRMLLVIYYAAKTLFGPSHQSLVLPCFKKQTNLSASPCFLTAELTWVSQPRHRPISRGARSRGLRLCLLTMRWLILTKSERAGAAAALAVVLLYLVQFSTQSESTGGRLSFLNRRLPTLWPPTNEASAGALGARQAGRTTVLALAP